MGDDQNRNNSKNITNSSTRMTVTIVVGITDMCNGEKTIIPTRHRSKLGENLDVLVGKRGLRRNRSPKKRIRVFSGS